MSECLKRDIGKWGEKVDRRNALEPWGVQLQQLSALVVEGEKNSKFEGGELRKGPCSNILKAQQPNGTSFPKCKDQYLCLRKFFFSWFGSELAKEFIQKSMH